MLQYLVKYQINFTEQETDFTSNWFFYKNKNILLPGRATCYTKTGNITAGKQKTGTKKR